MPWPTVAVITTGMDADTDTLPRADILDHTNKFNQLIAMRGVADGVCDLDATARVPNTKLDSTLTALAALDASVGVIHQTGADVFEKRGIATGGDVTAGKVLGVGWGGLGADSGLATSDWNAATANGIIYMSDTAANPPIAGWLIGAYHRHNSTYGTQFLATFQGSPRQFVRSLTAGVWGAWREVINYSIGATAERSATENGFQRLPGGLIIQWGTATVGNGVELAVNFPVAFATGAVRVIAMHQGGDASVNVVGRPISLTQCGLSHNFSVAVLVNYIATGF